jgi:hypothetical protein
MKTSCFKIPSQKIKATSIKILVVFSFLFNQFYLSSQTTIFSDNIGTTGTSGNSIATHESNSRFQVSALSYSGTGDVRNTFVSVVGDYATASGSFNVMLNANTETFIIDGINASSYSNLVFSFGVRKGTNAEDGSTLILEYSTSGVSGTYTAISFAALPTGTGTAKWYLRSSTSAIPNTVTTIRFRSTSATEFRVDDIKLEGTLPTCTTPDAIAYEVQPSTVQQDATMTAVSVKAICSGSGETATSYTGNVTLTINTPGCGYTAQTVAAVNGIATFSNIQISRSPQSNLTFTASASGFTSIVSSTFNVTVPGGVPVVTTITQNNFDALTSWTYGVGTPTTTGSGGSAGTDVVGVINNSGSNVLRKSYTVNNGTGERGTSNTVTFANQTGLAAYDQVDFTFQVYSFGSGVGGGNDSGEDFVLEVSTNNGGTWIPVLTKKGFSNCLYPLSTSPVTSLSIATHTVYTTGTCDTKSKFKLTLTGISQFQFRFTANNNRAEENWAIDNVLLQGTTIPVGSAFNLPTANAIDNFTVCIGEDAQLNVDVTSFLAPLSYSWTNPAQLNNASIQNPIALPTGASQTFTVTITDADNCIATDAVTVTNFGFGGTAGLWTGAFNENWFDCRNWSDGQIPTNTTDVVINQTALNSCKITDEAADCRSLSLTSNNGTHPDLTIETTGSLAVVNDISIHKTAGSGTTKLVLLNTADLSCRNLSIQGYSAGGAQAKLEHEFNTTSLLVRGNLSLLPGGELDLSDGNDGTQDGILELQGNYSNTASESDYKQSTSTFIFSGTVAQTISTSGFIEIFAKIIVNKSSGNVTLNNSIEIETNVEFIAGDINTGSNRVIFYDNATHTGTSNNSHVNGIVRKIGNEAFIFPVGNGTYFREARISAPLNTADHFTCQYFLVNPDDVPYDRSLKDPTLDHISACEYWQIDRTNGSSNVTVTLSWNAATSCGITLLSDLKVARWNGAMWKDHGNGGTTGNTTAGTVVTSAVVTAFSPFTLASSSAENPLPVVLTSFDINCLEQEVLLTWTTASERNASHFEIQSSEDNVTWNTINTITCAGNTSWETNYTYNLGNNSLGSYYRLVQYDFDGQANAFDAIYNPCSRAQINYFIYPNPVQSEMKISSMENVSSANIITLDGKIVSVFQANENTLQISNLSSGMYFVELKLTDGELLRITFVKE